MDKVKAFLAAVVARLGPVGAWLGTLRIQTWLMIGVFVVGMVLGGCVCNRWRNLVGEPPISGGSMGWLPTPEQEGGETRQAVASTLRRPLFADAGGPLFATPDKDALLYQAFDKLGKPMPMHDQDGVGCCVGEGFAGAVNLLNAVEILKGEPQEYKPVSSAAVYALSREFGGLLRSRGDGSFGSAAAKAVTFGLLLCEEDGTNNTDGKGHAAKARDWGSRGLPAELKEKAKTRKVTTASLVKTAEEIRIAITNGYPVAICSDVGFEPYRRDAEGFIRPGGQWAHCMFVAGYRADKKWFLIANSWGKSPPGGKSLNQPDNTHWTDSATMDRIARQGDSYALSALDGFPAQNVDNWFVRKLDWQVRRSAADRLARVFSLAF